jgi:hypothetical protein
MLLCPVWAVLMRSLIAGGQVLDRRQGQRGLYQPGRNAALDLAE